MSFASLKRPRILFGGGTALAAVAALVLALGPGSAGVASTQAASRPAQVVPASQSNDPNLYPFGAPTGNGDFKVPPPPESPTLVATEGDAARDDSTGACPPARISGDVVEGDGQRRGFRRRSKAVTGNRPSRYGGQ